MNFDNMTIDDQIKKNSLSYQIIGCAMEVYKTLGPGLLESVYQTALKKELEDNGFAVETEVPLPLNYKGVQMDCGYRMDMVINHKIIIELKSGNEFQPVHYKQLRTYLKLFSKNVGLLINFDVADFKNGCRRITLDNFHSWYE